MTLRRETLKELLTTRYKRAEFMLHTRLDEGELGLMSLIAEKHKIRNKIDENNDAIFITALKPEFFLGLGALLDSLYLFSAASLRGVRARLIKGYKYYN